MPDIFDTIAPEQSTDIPPTATGGAGDVFDKVAGTAAPGFPALSASSGGDVFDRLGHPEQAVVPTTPSNPEEGFIGKTWDVLNEPLLDIRHLTGTDPNQHPIISAIEDFGSGLTSPLSLALTIGTLGTAGLAEGVGAEMITKVLGEEAVPKVLGMAKNVGRLINAGFTVNQIHQVMKAIPTIGDALSEGDYPTAERLMTGALLNGAVATLGAFHGIKRFTEPETFNGVNKAIGAQDAAEEAGYRNIERTHVENKSLLNNKDMDRAAYLYGEAGGNVGILEAQKQAILATKNLTDAQKTKWSAAYDLAKVLPAEHRETVTEMGNEYAHDYHEGLDLGMFKANAPQVPHYFGQHVYDPEDAEASTVAPPRGVRKPGFTKPRVFDTITQALEDGFEPKEGTGLIASRIDYIKNFSRFKGKLAAQVALQDEQAADGRPIAILQRDVREVKGQNAVPLPAGIQPTEIGDQLITRGTHNYINVNGYKTGPPFGDSYLMIHPDSWKQVSQAFGEQIGLAASPALHAAAKFSAGVKQSVVSLSPFHWMTEALRGTQMLGVSRMGDVLRPPEIDEAGLAVTQGVPHGLTLNSLPYGSAVEGTMAEGGWMAKIPVVGNALKAANDQLFRVYIPRLKAISFEKTVETMKRFNPELPDDELYSRAAKQTNAAFGGLNWRQLGVSTLTRDFLRLVMLAPDFTGSQILFGKYALEKGGSPVTTSMIRIMAYNFLAAQALNLMTTGSVQLGHPFSVVSPDGQKTYTIRTMPSDIAHALTNPRNFLENKMSPITRAGLQTLTGRDETGRYMTGEQEVANLLRNIMPITTQGLIPGGPYGLGEQAVRGFGVGAYPNRSNAQTLMLEYLREQASQAPREPGKSDHYKMIDDLTSKFRKGQINWTNLSAGVEGGQLTLEEARSISKNGRLTPLAVMATKLTGVAGLQKLLEVYERATLPEKAELNPILQQKLVQYNSKERAKLPPMEQVYMDYLLSRKDRQ